MFDFIHEISQTLSHNKVRTALTGIAVTWGIFMLIVLLGLARGVTNNFDEAMADNRSSKIRVYAGKTSTPYRGNREGREIMMTENDLKSVHDRNQRYVDQITTSRQGSATIKSLKASISGDYNGIYPVEFSRDNFGSIVEGRTINMRDLDEQKKVVLIPETYASQFFPPDGKNAVRQHLSINGLSFLVVGVYSSEWNDQIYIPFTVAQMMAKNKNDLYNMSVNLKEIHSEEDAVAAEKGIRETLAANHNFDPKDENAIYVSNYYTNAMTVKQGMNILDTCVWILGILTLLTGIVGVSNIMFVTVRDRTHEIGIRRAIGARPHQILFQVIAESISITLVFGYIGIVLGMIATQLVAMIAESNNVPLSNPTVSLAIALEVTMVLVISGALAGLFPAIKALKVKPVEALHYE